VTCDSEGTLVWQSVRVSPKVSVVVPTYCPGDRLDALVRSLDAQTMLAGDYEVIFVDDGSPDDTWQRLQQIRDSHANVRLERIEHSGWPSRPRNVGLALAQGEYVLFMDHDDELYPRALEAGHAMAARCHADVLNGKETRTNQPAWAQEVYTANMANAVDRQDVHPLIPTNPHKLFRRDLLMEHEIRFPEGGRVLWEDVFFALDLAPHAKVISVLADTPFYHWVRTGRTASTSFHRNPREYWHWVRQIILKTTERLAGPELFGQWQLMLLHQYRTRVLNRLTTRFFEMPEEELNVIKEIVTDIVLNHIPDQLDALLAAPQLARAALVRQGRWDLLSRLVTVDEGLTGRVSTTSVRWTDDELGVSATCRWSGTQDTPLAIRYDGDRIVRDLPPDVAAALPEDAIDVGAQLQQAHLALGIRARDTAVSWMLPATSEASVSGRCGRPELTVTAVAHLAPDTAIFGRPLDALSWDFIARAELMGTIGQRRLPTTTRARTAMRGSRVYIAYRNLSGILSLDLDETNRSLAGSAPLKRESAKFTIDSGDGGRRLLPRRRQSISFEIPFSGVAAFDDSVIDGYVSLGQGPKQPARIVAGGGGAWLQATVGVSRGNHALTLNFFGRDVPAGLIMAVGSRGEVAFLSAQDGA
jgi:hypothetical protein